MFNVEANPWSEGREKVLKQGLFDGFFESCVIRYDKFCEIDQFVKICSAPPTCFVAVVFCNRRHDFIADLVQAILGFSG